MTSIFSKRFGDNTTGSLGVNLVQTVKTNRYGRVCREKMDAHVAGLQALKLEEIKAGKYDYGLPFDITGYWTKPGEKYWHHPLYYIMEQWDVNKATQNRLWQ